MQCKHTVSVTIKLTLTDRMGSKPNLSVKQSVAIGTMINFDGDGDGHWDGDDTCKRPLNVNSEGFLLGTVFKEKGDYDAGRTGA